MKNFHTFFVFLALSFVCLTAQAQLQIGLGAAAGRNFSTLDYDLANATNFEVSPGLAGFWGLEFAYLLTDRWRISVGAGFVLYDVNVKSDGLPFSFLGVTHQTLAFHTPVEIQHRLPLGNKNFLIFRGGGSLAIQSLEINEGTKGTSILFPGGNLEGAIIRYRFQNENPTAGYFRLGVGQEWRLGGQRNSSLQLSLLYVQGFSSLFEGSFEFWDVPPPQGVPLHEAIGTGLLPEPAETYPRFFSQGSYLCVDLKLYWGLVRQ